MKKILLVSHYFVPCTLTPAQRITYWAENLHRVGYYPIVVTRSWNSDIKNHHDTKKPHGNTVKVETYPTHEVHYLPFRPGVLDWSYLKFGETSFRFIFLTIKLVDVFLARLSLKFTSYANYLPYLLRLIEHGKLDQMIISGEPFYLFRLGYALKKKTGIRWIADYRDDWSTNELQMQKSGGLVRKWIATVESIYEKKWVGTADSIISVSEPYTQRICDFLRVPGITIQNGFEEKLLELPEQELYEQFTVMYSGVLYPSQDISLILGVLDKCYHLNSPFRLVFLGAGFDLKEKKRIEALVPAHLKPFVEITERIPRNEALVCLKKAHILLGIAYGSMKGIPSSKLYEYLALRKPILLCPTDEDVMQQILTETGRGYFARNSAEGKEVINHLWEVFFKEGSSEQFSEKSDNSVIKFSRFHQLEKLAHHLGNQ